MPLDPKNRGLSEPALPVVALVGDLGSALTALCTAICSQDCTVIHVGDSSALARESAPELLVVSLTGCLSHDVDAAISQLREALPRTAILAVVESGEIDSMLRALAAGALDVVERPLADVPFALRVRGVVRSVVQGRRLERSQAARQLIERMCSVESFELPAKAERVQLRPTCAALFGLASRPEGFSLDELGGALTDDSAARLRGFLAALASSEASQRLELERRDGTSVELCAQRQRDWTLAVRELPAPREASAALATPSGATIAKAQPAVEDTASFLRAIELAVGGAKQTSRHVGVLFLDAGQRHTLRGSLTHGENETLMREIQRAIRESIRRQDGLAALNGDVALEVTRLRGNEFAVLAPQLTRAEDAAKIGTRIFETLSKPFVVAGREIHLSACIGVACFPQDHERAEELLRRAETAAQCARQEGHDHLRFFTPNMDARAFERLALEASLRHALERNELLLQYQPQVDLRNQRIVGVEALVRWRHPELGMISPVQFVPLAEETGLIVPIGQWVLREACRQNKAWQDAGLPPVRMAVNLSAVQFTQPRLLEDVRSALGETGLEPRWFELELTESVLMQDARRASGILERLAQAGVHLAIDDFGTGYSSLAYLKRFPIDALKIDRSFIMNSTMDRDDAAIVTSIVLLGHSLKLRVVAEGVEQASQLAFLRALLCDEAQGYLFSRPVGAQECAALLAKGLSNAAAA